MTSCPQCEALKERVRELEGRVRALEQEVREPAEAPRSNRDGLRFRLDRNT